MSAHIVMAEDADGTRLTFAAVLRKAGYKVSLARNGKEALELIRKGMGTADVVNLLVTDIWMEELDGLQLMDALAAQAIKLPVLAMTGYGDKDLMLQLMKKGCADYIEKPFGSAELLNHVKEILSR